MCVCVWLTDNLWFGTDGGDVLRPVGWNGATQLQERRVAAVGMERAPCIVDDLFGLDFVSNVPLIVSTSFEKASPCKLL